MSDDQDLVSVVTSDWSRSQFELVTAELQLRKIEFTVGIGEIRISPRFQDFVSNLVAEGVGQKSGSSSLAFMSAKFNSWKAKIDAALQEPPPKLKELSQKLPGNLRNQLVVGVIGLIFLVVIIWSQFFPRYSAKFSNCAYDRQSPSGYVYCELNARNKTFSERVFDIDYRVRDSTGRWFENSSEILVPARSTSRNPRFEMGLFSGFPSNSASISVSITGISVR